MNLKRYNKVAKILKLYLDIKSSKEKSAHMRIAVTSLEIEK